MNKDNKVLNDNELNSVSGGANTNIGDEHDTHNVGAYISPKISTSEQSPKPDAPVVGCFVGLPGFP